MTQAHLCSLLDESLTRRFVTATELEHLTAALAHDSLDPTPTPTRIAQWDSAFRKAQRRIEAEQPGALPKLAAFAQARAALWRRWDPWHQPDNAWGWQALAEAVAAFDVPGMDALLDAPGAPDGAQLSAQRLPRPGTRAAGPAPVRSLLGWLVDPGSSAADPERRLALVKRLLARGVDPNAPTGDRDRTRSAVDGAEEPAMLKALLRTGGRLACADGNPWADWLTPDLPLYRLRTQLAVWRDDYPSDGRLRDALPQAWPTLVGRFAARMVALHGRHGEPRLVDLIRSFRSLGLQWGQDVLNPRPGEPALWGEWDRAILTLAGSDALGSPWRQATPTSFLAADRVGMPDWGRPWPGRTQEGLSAAVWMRLRTHTLPGGDGPTLSRRSNDRATDPAQAPDFWTQVATAIPLVVHAPSRWRLWLNVRKDFADAGCLNLWRIGVAAEISTTLHAQMEDGLNFPPQAQPPFDSLWSGNEGPETWRQWLGLLALVAEDLTHSSAGAWPATAPFQLLAAQVLNACTEPSRVEKLWQDLGPSCDDNDRRRLQDVAASRFARRQLERAPHPNRPAAHTLLRWLALEWQIPAAQAPALRLRL